MKNTNTPKADENSAEYKTMVDLLAVYTEASNRLAELQNSINDDFMQCVDDCRQQYADLQLTIANTERALEMIATKHPEWFGNEQSIKTPYGSVHFRKSAKIEVSNEELSIVLIEQEAQKNPEFKLDTYLRTKREINLEAFDQADESTLKKFRLNRIENDNFSVKPAKVDLGKAVKAAEKKAA